MRRWPDPYLFPGQDNGRPRKRFYVTDYPDATIDANALRRQTKDAGGKIAAARSVQVTWTDRDGERHDAEVEIEVRRHPLYGGRWWLRCPRCRTRRGKLYVAKGGPACRCCLRLVYPRRKRVGFGRI